MVISSYMNMWKSNMIKYNVHVCILHASRPNLVEDQTAPPLHVIVVGSWAILVKNVKGNKSAELKPLPQFKNISN
jgi:hypothetical protein